MDLFELPGEDNVLQELDQSLVYPLVFSSATLSGVPNGDMVNLTVHPNITVNGPVGFLWYRQNIDFSQQNNSEGAWFQIANTTSRTINDTVLNEAEWKVNYIVTAYALGSNSIIATTNTYEFDHNPGAALPWWFAIVIAVPIALVALGALIGAAVYARKNKPEWFAATKPKREKERKAKDTPVPLSSLAAAEGVSSVSSGSAPGSPTPLAPGGLRKEYTVNIDYIMTGAKGVRVREGNPTAPKPEGEEEYSEEDLPQNHEEDQYASSPRDYSSGSGKKSWRHAVRDRLRKIFFCF